MAAWTSLQKHSALSLIACGYAPETVDRMVIKGEPNSNQRDTGATE